MSGPPVITLDEEIQFLRSIVMPSFKHAAADERDDWMRSTAKRFHWSEDMADWLILTYGHCPEQSVGHLLYALEVRRERREAREAKEAEIRLAEIQMRTAEIQARGEYFIVMRMMPL